MLKRVWEPLKWSAEMKKGQSSDFRCPYSCDNMVPIFRWENAIYSTLSIIQTILRIANERMANDFSIADAYSMLTQFGISKGNGTVKEQLKCIWTKKKDSMIHTSIFDKDLKTFAWAQADWHVFQVLVASKDMETRRTWRVASADLGKSRVAVISVMVMNTYAGEIIDSHECFSPYWPNRSRGVHTTPGKWDR